MPPRQHAEHYHWESPAPIVWAKSLSPAHPGRQRKTVGVLPVGSSASFAWSMAGHFFPPRETSDIQHSEP